MGLGQENGPVKIGVPAAGFRHRSLTNDQDKPVKAGVPGEEERSGYDQHPCSRSTSVVEVTVRGVGSAAGRPPIPPTRANVLCSEPLEIQLTHAQDSGGLIFVGLRQRAVVVVDVDAAAKHIVH